MLPSGYYFLAFSTVKAGILLNSMAITDKGTSKIYSFNEVMLTFAIWVLLIQRENANKYVVFPLQKQLMEQVPALVNAIKLIYEISPCFNTSERMTSLLLKVTNQMITSCRVAIYQGAKAVWDLPRYILLLLLLPSYCKNTRFEMKM